MESKVKQQETAVFVLECRFVLQDHRTCNLETVLLIAMYLSTDHELAWVLHDIF